MINMEILNTWIAPLDAILDVDATGLDVAKETLIVVREIRSCPLLKPVAAAYWAQRFMLLISKPYSSEKLKEEALYLRNDIVGLFSGDYAGHWM